MKTIATLAITVALAAFAFSVPSIAADTTPTLTQPKANITDAMKDKAGQAVEQAKQKADTTASKIEESLGAKKDAAQPKSEVVDVQQETVTVQTPQGTAQETEITVTPETPAAPQAAPAK